MSTLGSEIRMLRENKGMSLAQLAKEVDIPESCLEDVENGRRRLGTQTLKKLAIVLDIEEEHFSAMGLGIGDKIEKETGEYISSSAGRKLRQIREEIGLTLVECGKKAGISYTHISEIERGNVCPSLKTLEKLALALEKPVSFFLRGNVPLTLGERVRKLREAQGLTQVKLAAQVGISDSLVAQVETGKAQPSLNTLEKLAETLGVSADYFLTQPKEASAEVATIVPLRDWSNNKKSRDTDDILKGFGGWHRELAIEILQLISQYAPEKVEAPTDPIILEISGLLQELPLEKKLSVLDYIKFVARNEEVQANY